MLNESNMLLDSNVSVVEDELGCSLTSDVSMLSGSLIVTSDVNMESEIDFEPSQFVSSTPFKQGRNVNLVDSDISAIDDELGCSLITDETTVEENSSNLVDISCDLSVDTNSTEEMASSSILYTDLEQFANVYAVPSVSSKRSANSRARHLEKALDETAILRSITQSCDCPKRCTEKIDYQFAFNTRNLFWSKKREQRSEHLIMTLSYSQKNGKYTYVFLENGEEICIKAYQLLLSLNKNSVTRHKKLAASGAISPYYKIKQTDPRNVLSNHWLENYASMYGDKMPNNKDILLPYRTVKKSVYHCYKSETASPVSESAFYNFWSKHFPHLKIKKTNTFTQCTKCAFLIAKLSNTPSLEGKRMIRRERNYHIQRQMLERKHYYGKKESSRQHPEEFLSLIIDGMDQSKTDLPHFVGRQANGTLPSVLFLQADNCRRENKNKYILAFLELLVRQRIFREVYFSFLIVGHTHEDIDAAFSKISRSLKKTRQKHYQIVLSLSQM